MKKIAILGDGGWGTTLAIHLCKKGYNISLWGAFLEYIELLRKKRENIKFLPGVTIPESINLYSDLDESVKDAWIIVLAIPAQFMRSVLNKLKKTNFDKTDIFLNVAKGIEIDTLMRMSKVVKDVLGKVEIATLSGPSISYEVARQIPTTVVISCENIQTAQTLQDVFISDRFRVYTGCDLIGVELGGALKNIIAIAAGISDGLGFGTNTKAALVSRGLIEISRLGVAMGAKEGTFRGLSGLGDLITTCISPHGRNRQVGEQIGKGKNIRDILDKMDMVAEGVTTVKAACRLAEGSKVDMPIARKVYKILYENENPFYAVNELMTRERKNEF